MLSVKRYELIALCTSVFIFGLSVPLPAQETARKIDPLADRILRQMSQTLQQAQAFTFQAETTTDEVSRSGQKIQYSAMINAAVRRPNKLMADANGDRVRRTFWYDGRSITLLDRFKNLYATAPAPPAIDDALEYAIKRFGVSAPLADLVFSNPYAVLMENVRSGRYLGLHSVRGKSCNHLVFSQENIDWQIWIENNQQSLPCKVVITYKQENNAPQYTAILTKWNLKPELSDQAFTFVAPAGSSQIEFLPRVSEKE